MKNVQGMILVASALAAHLATAADVTGQAYIDSFKGRSDSPIPISVVTPEIPAYHGGITLMVEFVVDATGKPEGVTVRDADGVSRLVVKAVVAAAEQWRFQPRLRDGVPVRTRVIVPFRIVDELQAGGMLVAK